MKKLIKPKIIFGIPLAALSFEIYLGVVLGYFGSKFFVDKLVKTKIVDSFIFNIGRYKLYLHHWIVGSVILILSIWYNFLPLAPFSFGFLSGLILEDLHRDENWHKILFSNKKEMKLK